MKNQTLRKIIIFSIIFLLGILCATIINACYDSGLENPLSWGSSFLGFSQADTPYDFIDREDILVYGDKVIINIDGVSIGRYASTGSMKPLLDENSNGIRITPNFEEDIHIGDIITFEKNGDLIIHRVIDKGVDNNGTYFITKGDNNNTSDGKIRFEDIKYLTIGILW